MSKGRSSSLSLWKMMMPARTERLNPMSFIDKAKEAFEDAKEALSDSLVKAKDAIGDNIGKGHECLQRRYRHCPALA